MKLTKKDFISSCAYGHSSNLTEDKILQILQNQEIVERLRKRKSELDCGEEYTYANLTELLLCLELKSILGEKK